MEELPIANLRASSKHVGICPPELRSHICGSTCAPCSELACSRLHSQALVRVHIPSSHVCFGAGLLRSALTSQLQWLWAAGDLQREDAWLYHWLRGAAA